MPQEVLDQIKKVAEKIGSDFEEYKKTNDERIEKLAKEESTAELEQKLAKIEESLSKNTELKDRLDAMEAAMKRQKSAKSSDGLRELTEDEVKHRDLMLKYFRHKREFAEGNELAEISRKTLNLSNDPDGGYYVEPDTTGRMVQKIFETSPVRQVASTQTISTDYLEGWYDGDEAGAEWIETETGTPSDDTTPQMGKWRIQVWELATEPKITQRLIEDANWDPEAFLIDKVTRKFVRTENTAFVVGDGEAKPRGMLTYPDGTTRGTVERIQTGHASQILPDSIYDLTYGLQNEYRVAGQFAMNRSTMAVIRKLKDQNDQYLWQPSFQAGQPAQLTGYPLIEFPDMPAVAADALPVIFGDFAEFYQIVDRFGFWLLRDPYTNKGFVKLYVRRRVGGDVINFDAAKILEVSA